MVLVVLGIVVEDLDTVVAVVVVVDNCNRVGNLALVGCIHIHTGWVVGTHYRVGVDTHNF